MSHEHVSCIMTHDKHTCVCSLLVGFAFPGTKSSGIWDLLPLEAAVELGGTETMPGRCSQKRAPGSTSPKVCSEYKILLAAPWSL
jgi:hypothetical protein